VLNPQSHAYSILIAVVHQHVDINVTVSYNFIPKLLDSFLSAINVLFSREILQKVVSIGHNFPLKLVLKWHPASSWPMGCQAAINLLQLSH
jgi:hypothetical protein